MDNSSSFAVYSNDTGKRLASGLKGTALRKFLVSHWKEQDGKPQEYTIVESHRPAVKEFGKFKTKHIAVCSKGKVKYGKRLFSN